MRRAFVLVSLAVTSMVALALLVPLALVVWRLAADDAVAAAQRRIGAVAPVVAAGADRATVAAMAGRKVTVILPGGAAIGTPRLAAADVVSVRRALRLTEVGRVLAQPVPLSRGGTAVVEATVRTGALPPHVLPAWSILTGVAAGLIAASVLVADRLGARVVGAVRRLGAAAMAVGAGDLMRRVDPEGPPELQDVGRAFNTMTELVVQQLAAEREIAADLSHRLRTPLTALKLNVDALGPDPVADEARVALGRLEGEVDLLIRSVRRSPNDHAPGTCEAGEVVKERLAFWSVLAEDQSRWKRLIEADRAAWVPVGRRELAAALDALLGNVFRHTDEGTGFAVTVRAGQDRVGILVADAGPGIADPENAAHRGASGAGSTGLGLDIARRTAESTGGQLRIGRSMLGGAEVAIWLRCVDTARPRRARLRRAHPTDI